ncbi:hypothetical protein [Enterococcus sp. AZ194]|uniref:hypothetical protein n=1 Tax=Enterococcus sp. AZ194 TaxID=2774629 RepID=UPI003F689776
MDHQAANFVGFDWSRSKLNINHELLKDVYNLDEAELNSLSRVEKKEWLDDIDIMDKMTRRYELLVKEYKAFLQK